MDEARSSFSAKAFDDAKADGEYDLEKTEIVEYRPVYVKRGDSQYKIQWQRDRRNPFGGGMCWILMAEGSPAQALYELSERFEADGDEAARVRTLEHLMERYPSSRFAERARVVLGRAR